jgi:hypothetical protein
MSIHINAYMIVYRVIDTFFLLGPVTPGKFTHIFVYVYFNVYMYLDIHTYVCVCIHIYVEVLK